MKKVIVSGAGGFVGSALINRLLCEDVHIWALERGKKATAWVDSHKITRIKDSPDIWELKSLFDINEYDVFYDFAWQGVNGPDKAKYSVQVENIMLTLRYAELASAIGCKKFLCAGTIAERAVDSLPCIERASAGMMYGAAKKCAHTMLEAYCKSIGLDFIWMQFANIYGPRNLTGNLVSYTIDRLSKGLEASFGPAEQPYDFLYIDDLIEAVYRLGIMSTRENFYYIGSGSPRVLKEYLMDIGRAYGRKELIHIGARDDDGIRYSYEMLDSSAAEDVIGQYVTAPFEEHIVHTIKRYMEMSDGTKI